MKDLERSKTVQPIFIIYRLVLKDWELKLVAQQNHMLKKNEKKRMVYAFNQFMNGYAQNNTTPDEFVENHLRMAQSPPSRLDTSARYEGTHGQINDYGGQDVDGYNESDETQDRRHSM